MKYPIIALKYACLRTMATARFFPRKTRIKLPHPSMQIVNLARIQHGTHIYGFCF